MVEENQEVAETEAPVAGAPESTTEHSTEQPPAVETVAEEAPASEAPASEEEPVDPEILWRNKELNKKHAQIKERDRQIAEQAQRIADLEAIAQRASAETTTEEMAPAELTRPSQSPKLTQEQIQAEARKLFEQQQYQDNLLRINSAGEKTYKADWTKALENLATFGEFETGTMQSIMATDAPEKVLYELGKNPGEYQRIMELPAPRRHTEFVKLSLKQEAPKPKPSNAPAPTEPIQARVSPSTELSDKDDDETWYKKRALQREARRKARIGV